jgi:hypothetical protein
VAATWQWRATGDPLYVSSAAGTLTLSFAGRSSVSFDGAGRLWGAWLDGITYRRSLDNRVLAKWIDAAAPGTRARRFLPEGERQAVIERAYAAAGDVTHALAVGALETSSSPATWTQQMQAWLSTVIAWSWPRLQDDACHFHTIYKPVSILPPDQYLALVLQATEGCSYNRCTFCTFYRDRPFRIKSVEEFAAHCDYVRDYLGAGITVRRSIFLADANAVIAPQRVLLPMLDEVNRCFPVRPVGAPRGPGWELDGIYAFISAPDALRKRAEDFAVLRARGVRRLYVGLETGHDPLRAFLAKQGSAAEVVEAVAAMKAGGMDVGVIFMLGIGGEGYRTAHFADTVATIRQMPLGSGDLVYLSPFVADEPSPYLDAMQAAGLAPLQTGDLEIEEQRFKRALMPWAAARGVRVSNYDVREFIY